MTQSKIAEWTEKPWNPVTGCTKISSGCHHCYAEKLATTTFQRWKNPRYINGFKVTLHEDLLDAPIHWKKPQRIFTCSMSDLFHSEIPDSYIFKVFDTMNKCSQHTFLVLTKRSRRLVEISDKIDWPDNIWMGVTVEESKCKFRVDDLRVTKAKHKFICAEPLLEDLGVIDLSGIDWVFVGGESGPMARKMEETWVIGIKDQCEAQQVMFTFKQWGGEKRKKNGSLLQGKYYHDMPQVMRVP